MSHPVRQYVKTARQHGMSNEQIIKALTDAGWQTHQVIDLVLEAPRPEGPETIISVRSVSKFYGSTRALDNISLEVKRGTVTALLGPNGAGKTTLVRILATLLTPSLGDAAVAGLNVVKGAQQLRSVIGLAGQNVAVDEVLSGRENLEMVSRLYHLTPESSQLRANELLQQFDLVDAADRAVKTYSGGMRRRLDLAASLVIRPKVLFLDEPTTGLDPRSRFTMWNVIRDLVEGGTTILLTTQYLEEADQLAHYILVIDHGRIIAQGTADDLKTQVGGDVLELHLTLHDQAGPAADMIADLGDDYPHANADNGIVTMPTSRGAAVLVEVVRRLDSAHIKLSDVMLRRPSLDDVFMKLTGHVTFES